MVAIALDNALTVEFMEQQTFGDTEEFAVAEGTGMLVELGFVENTGVVVATEGFGDAGENMVTLGNIVRHSDDDDKEVAVFKLMKDPGYDYEYLEIEMLEVAGVDVNDLIGREVTIWSDDDEDEPEGYLVEIDSAMTVLVKEAEITDDSDALLEIGDEEYELADEYWYGYNRYEMEYDEDDDCEWMEDYYLIVTIDDDDEIISVYEFYPDTVNKRIDEIDAKRDKLNFTDGSLDLEFDDDEDDFTDVLFMKGLEFIAFEDLEEDDVLAYSEGEENVYMVVVEDEKVEGEVTKVSSDGYEITVDGEKIDLNDDTSIEDGADAADLLEEDVVVYMGYNGYAAFVDYEEEESNEMYGLVITFGDDEDRGDVTPWVKLFNAEGEEVVYETDTDDYESVDEFASYVTADALVVYELNDDGEITSIGEPEYYSTTTVTYLEDKDLLFEDDDADEELDVDEARYEIVEDASLFNYDDSEEEWILADLVDEEEYVDAFMVYDDDDYFEVIAAVLIGDVTASSDTMYAVYEEYALIPDAYALDLWTDELEKIDTEEDYKTELPAWGTVVDYTVNEDGDVDSVTETALNVVGDTGYELDDVDGTRLYYDGTFIDVEDDAQVYYVDELEDDDIEVYELGDLDEGMEVEMYYNTDNEVVVVVVTDLLVED